MDINNLPTYVAPKGVNINHNDFAVDINNPESIASVLQYIIDNFDDFMSTLYERLPYGETFRFLTLNSNGEYVPIHEMQKHDLYDEETFAKAAIEHPELQPLLVKLASLIIHASEQETASGPWATEETILGQFLIPELAEQDGEYLPLLKGFMEASCEIQFSPRFQEYFDEVFNDICDGLGIDPDDVEDFDDDDDENFGDADGMYIDVSETIDANWDELLQKLLNVEDIDAEDKKHLKKFVEKSNEYSNKHILFDNGILFIATDQDGDEVYIHQPYISLSISVNNYGYGDSANISNHVDDYVELDLPDELHEIVYNFLAENGYDVETVNAGTISYTNYTENTKLDLNNIKLPADTDFADVTTDQDAGDYEIWHNTPLINKILKSLLEHDGFSDDERIIIKQFVAGASTYNDMYFMRMKISGAPTQIYISCLTNKPNNQADMQVLVFMFEQNMLSVNIIGGSNMTHYLQANEKEKLMELFKADKPEWLN